MTLLKANRYLQRGKKRSRLESPGTGTILVERWPNKVPGEKKTTQG